MNCLSCKQINQTLNLFLTIDGNCVSICPNDTYKLELNKTCLKYCPHNYEINKEKNKCIEKKEQLSSSQFKSQIENNIVSLINSVNSTEIIDGPDFIAAIIPSDNMNPNE